MASADYAAERRLAALRSLDEVGPDMLLGLGSGSTVAALVPLLGRRVQDGLRVRAVCASSRTRALAEQAGVPLLPEDGFTRLDLTIDGADEIDARLNTIKGGGGALLREKVLAAAADRVVLIADSRKPVARLGQGPLPVEVVPFGWPSIARHVTAVAGAATLRADPATGRPFVTDEGNYILDCRGGPIADPAGLAARLAAIPGVMAHGLFLGLAGVALIARGDRVEVLTPQAAG
jgi:ribose 5-phosphate isomerase A